MSLLSGLHGPLATNVSLGTSNVLAYLLGAVVAVYILSSLGIAWYYYNRNKKMGTAAPPSSA